MDHNSPDATEVGPRITDNHNRVRFSTAIGYLEPFRQRLYPTIRPNSMVHHLQFHGNRATGALVESGGERVTVEGDEIFLSARAMGSPYANKME